MTKEEFEKAVREHRRYILKFVRKKVAEDDVEDIVQQVLKELADSKAYLRFRGDSSVKTWLVGAVRKRVVDWYRKRDRSRKKEKEIVDRLKLEQKLDDPYQSPEDELIQIEKNELKQARFKEAEQRLEHLPPDMQDAFWQYGKGTSWAKIATALEINKKTLETRVRRVRKRFTRTPKRSQGRPMAALAPKKMVLEAHLLHPAHLRILEALKSGQFKDPPKETTLTVPLLPKDAADIHKRGLSWIETRDIEELVEILWISPFAIAHPAVFWQMLYLRAIIYRTNAELKQMGEGIDPAVVRQEAHNALRRLVSGWVERMLPEWTIQPIKVTKREGRPRKTDEGKALELLEEFSYLYQKLEKYPTTSFSPKPRGRRDDFIERTVRLVQKLHAESWRFLEDYRVPEEEEGPDWTTFIYQDLKAREIRLNPLPIEIANSVAKKAVPKRSVRKRDLIYGLLAHYWNMSFDTVRRLIERTETDFPD